MTFFEDPTRLTDNKNRSFKSSDLHPGQQVPTRAALAPTRKDLSKNANNSRLVSLLKKEYDLQNKALKKVMQKTGKAVKGYFNYFSQPCLLMDERHQKLRFYADREHDNPIAQKYAQDLQALLHERGIYLPA